MKVLGVSWFFTFGALPCLMVLVSQPWHVALSLYMAYVLGGMAVFMLQMPHMPSKKDRSDEVVSG